MRDYTSAPGLLIRRVPLRWLKVNEHESLGIDEAQLHDLVTTPLGDWGCPPGLAGLPGYQF